MNHISIFPTSYLPPVALMSAMCKEALRCGEILIERQETFPKQTYRNRTVILTSKGPMALSVPVVRPNGTHTCISEIIISYSERWNINHIRALDAAYNASPYYFFYRDEIHDILLRPFKKILDLNEALLQLLFKKIKIETKLSYTNEFFGEDYYQRDFRKMYSYKHPESLPKMPEYVQVFRDRTPFCGNIGILDLLFNYGPETRDYLIKLDN